VLVETATLVVVVMVVVVACSTTRVEAGVAASIPESHTVNAASPVRAPPINTTSNMRERDTPRSG
jgi:hypothetical protein